MLLSLIGAMLLPGSHTESLTAFDTELPKSDYLEASITSVAPPSHGFTLAIRLQLRIVVYCVVLFSIVLLVFGHFVASFCRSQNSFL